MVEHTEFKVLTWNCKRAVTESGVWDYLLELDPDVAFLQEVGTIPAKVLAEFKCYQQKAIVETGGLQKFSTAIMVRGRIGDPISLQAPSNLANAELERLSGNLICRELLPNHGSPLKAVSVYSPAWKIAHNPEVWLTDILLESLRYHIPGSLDSWIVAGDFNLSETFDQKSWSAGGNRAYLDQMSELGLTECLRKHRGALTPTFRNTKGGAIIHQMDHMFVTEALASRLVFCDTGSQERVFGAALSDHLPVVAVFRN